MTTHRDFIQSLYDAFQRGDAAFVLGSFADDIQWNEAEGNPLAERNPYDSPAAVGEGVFGYLLGLFDGFAATPEALVAEGDEVVAFGRYTGVHRETGDELDAQFVHRWTIADGKVSHFQQYTDTAQWVRLLG